MSMPPIGRFVIVRKEWNVPAIAYLKRCDEDDGVFCGKDVFFDGDRYYFPDATHWTDIPEGIWQVKS